MRRNAITFDTLIEDTVVNPTPNIVNQIETPAFVIDAVKLEQNAALLNEVGRAAGCAVLLAQKAFSMFSVYPLLEPYIQGVCASGLYEARLGADGFNGEVHTYSPAFKNSEIQGILNYSDHITFNSFAQWHRYRELAEDAGVSCGLRINPECSTASTALYDPCRPNSRLGIRAESFSGQSLEGISGLHFHTLCEQNVGALETTLTAVEEKFGFCLPQMAWVNFGGGHHITREDYQVDLLIELIRAFRKQYGVRVYLEPGEAVALDAGVFVSSVLDVIENEVPVAVMDCSCTCHMPDVLEMPYRPDILEAAHPGVLPFTYELGGISCLAGDSIGRYSFSEPLHVGQRLVFRDMAHYTMVKTTTFNGVGLPSIYVKYREGLKLIKTFGYDDFKSRLS